MKPTTRTTRFRRPEIEHKPTLPPGATCGSCPHLRQLHRHRLPALPLCTWQLSPGRRALGRLDRMACCPLAENLAHQADADADAAHHLEIGSAQEAAARGWTRGGSNPYGLAQAETACSPTHRKNFSLLIFRPEIKKIKESCGQPVGPCRRSGRHGCQGHQLALW